MDDTFVIIKSSLKQQFTDDLNAQHPSIKFTTEDQGWQLTGDSRCLGISFSRRQYILQWLPQTYTTDHYLKLASHQPLEHKLRFIHTLRHSANTTVSNDEEKIKENQRLKKVLSLTGYPKWHWGKPAATSKRTDSRSKRLVKGHVTLPYIQEVTETLVCILCADGIIVQMCTLLVAPKISVSKNGPVRSYLCFEVWRLWFRICRWDWLSSQEEDEWAPQRLLTSIPAQWDI